MTAPLVPSRNALQSLVMNKRKLPAILRGNVPPLHIVGTPIQPLVATRKNLWGALHPDVGKRIRHKGCSVTIVNVHRDIRQIEDAYEKRCWIPRRPANKRELRIARIKFQYKSGVRRVFSQPCWTGEPRPTDRVTVPFEDAFGEIPESTKRFLCSIGREQARLLVKSAKETLLMSAAARLSNLKEFLRSRLAVKTKEFTEDETMEVLRRSQMSENRINAVYDVVLGRIPKEQAAHKRNLEVYSLKRTLRWVRAKVHPRVEKRLREWLSHDPELATAYRESESLKDAQVVIAATRGLAQDGRY